MFSNNNNNNNKTKKKDDDASSNKGSNKDVPAEIASKVSDALKRGSPLYHTTLSALQWQRDSYLMSPEYADKRKTAREVRPNVLFLPRINVNVKHHDPNNKASFGTLQLVHLGSWFIPSPAVKAALKPIVLSQLQPVGGSLYEPALRGIIGLIDSQQSNMDALVKDSICDMLEQGRLRHLVMTSTKGYIADRNYNRNYNYNNPKQQQQEGRTATREQQPSSK